jgi:hypothetical protein
MANGGFFLVNTFSMLSPYGWEVSTPPELKPWGWTSVDLLSAPTVTALYATLTRSKGFWTALNTAVVSYAGYTANNTLNSTIIEGEKTMGALPPSEGAAFDPESARAICALVLMGMFGARTIKNFGKPALPSSGKF